MRALRAERPAATARVVLALILREMSTTYGRSPGGYAWAVLEPLAGIVLLTVIFSATGLRAPPLGANFALFYATGLLPLLAFTTIVGKLLSALNFSKALLAYPAITYVDALVARFILGTLTQIMVAGLLFGGIFTVFDTKTVLDPAPLVEAYLLLSVLALGIGTANCFLASMFPVWQSIWSIFTRPLLLVSCTFYVLGAVPQPYRDWLWYNPLVHVVGLVRRAVYAGYEAAYVSELYLLGLAAGTLLFGVVFLHRHARDILYQ
ncbi:MAG: ABC transporter permease [Pseudomonadota bacterium]